VTDAIKNGVDWVVSRATVAGWTVDRRSDQEAILLVPITHADGLTISYRIVVWGEGPQLLAREDPDSRKLPAFCPNRHIIHSGAFCMYWEEDRRFDVVDALSAEAWLNLLLDFLRSQRRAAQLRKWPTDEAWAHGEQAAEAQRKCELTALRLGAPWPEWVLGRHLKATRELGNTFRVHRGEQLLYSTVQSPNRFAPNGERRVLLYEPSKTGSQRRISKSSKRALLLRTLAVALWQWQNAEKNFWRMFSDRPCCGTMEDCFVGKNL
jgi:hypothetical protein